MRANVPPPGRPNASPSPPAEKAENRDRAANREPAEPAEATEKADPADPIEPTDKTEPTEPIDSTEPSLAIDRNELRERRSTASPRLDEGGARGPTPDGPSEPPPARRWWHDGFPQPTTAATAPKGETPCPASTRSTRS